MTCVVDEYAGVAGATLVADGTSGGVYACTLNQTEVGEDTNKNKFYIMQVFKDLKGTFYFYTRWGRIGLKGRPGAKPCPSQSAAVADFTKQFKAKTGNNWEQRAKFVQKSGKYHLSSVNTLTDEQIKAVEVATTQPKILPSSTLSKPVQDLLTRIGDLKMMNEALVRLEIDTKKMPLGKIDQSQLDLARAVLDQIKLVLAGGTVQAVVPNLSKIKIAATKTPPKLNVTVKSKVPTIPRTPSPKPVSTTAATISALSSKYYTYVPVACGMKKPPLIDNAVILQKYYDTLASLADISIGVKILNASTISSVNPLDSIYADINTTITPLDRDSDMWKQLTQYVANTHGSTHDCKLEVMDIFAISQLDKEAKYEKFCRETFGDNEPHRTLLFHGTPQSCVLSICKRDFFLDPSQLGVTIAGKMFGYGIYFADMASKSFNYTRADATGNVGCLLVAEVALGTQHELNDAAPDINLSKLSQSNCHSTKGCGKWFPDPNASTKIDGVNIPNGPVVSSSSQGTLRYNEHIVYNTEQQCIRYLILVKNNGGYGGY